jgi:photosystem I subunit PsaN
MAAMTVFSSVRLARDRRRRARAIAPWRRPPVAAPSVTALALSGKQQKRDVSRRSSRAASRPATDLLDLPLVSSVPSRSNAPQAVLSSKVSTGLKAQRKSVKSVKATGAVAMLGDKQKAAAIALAAAVAVAAPAFPAKADLTSDLLARTEANKELNDKKRALTSSANFERARTVTDGVCEFPKNFLGCEIASSKGGVAFLSDDKDIECEGTRDGKVCASKAPGSFPPVFGM